MAAAEQPASFGALVRRAAESRPDEPAVIDADVRWSWAELSRTVARLAAAFVGCGLRVDDRIAIQAASSAEFVAVYLAALQAELVVVPINPAYTLPELEHILADSGARMLVTGSVAVVEAAAELRERHPQLLGIVVAARSASEDLQTVTELIEGAGSELLEQDGRTGEQLAVLLYTSGTSGRPKGAMLPVRALLGNLGQLAQLSPPPLTAADRIFLPLPLFHIFGLNAGLGMALYFGATLVLSGRFDAEASLATIRDERISVVVGAPLEFAQWAARPEVAEAFAGVRFALSGSAPLSAELVGSYAGFGVALFEGYGLTEAAPVVTVNLVPAEAGAGWADPKPGSVGRPLPGVEVRLTDSDGELAEVGDLGLLEVRGSNLFTGYWPDSADGPDAEGWFGTGDLAVADDEGDYYLVGRRGDLVLVNGFNVYPAEVEAVFARLAGVREVAVLGMPDTGSDAEVIVAYVVPEAGTVLDPAALIAQAAGSLARFKLPRRVVEADTLPHTATGKVMKWRLRNAAAGPS
ncbi:MAG: AMP-binding protein [Actinomycetota bacterium]|nr:AMP-binding protein [Actinomycetota bacterium]MDQ2956078.1 AMP-binding protein [Actinomycetota bacterium]